MLPGWREAGETGGWREAGESGYIPALSELVIDGDLNMGANNITGTRNWKLDLSGDGAEYWLSEADNEVSLFLNSTRRLNLKSGYMHCEGAWVFDNDVPAYFGTSLRGSLTFRTNQTPDSLMLGLPSATSNGLIVCRGDDVTTDFGRALQSDPTAFFQAGLDGAGTVAMFGSLAHNKTHFVIGTGAGGVQIKPVGTDGWLFDVAGGLVGTLDDIGEVTSTAALGLSLMNEEAATVGTDQFSPMLLFGAHGWKSSGGTSENCQFGMQVRPSAGFSPTDILSFFSNVSDAGFVEVLRLEASTTLGSGETSLWLYDDDNTALVQVKVGADDSGGAGYKLLRIAN